jgi:nucleotide-binding universal stress UspA family protein
MNTVIAPIDFSRASRGVIDEAIRIARGVQGRVVVLHVVKPAVLASEMAPMAAKAHEMTAEVERVARAQLLAIRCIVEQAATQTARYIVLGSHGNNALRQLVVGGTASGVLKQAGCPVVVVPPWKRAVAA